MLAFEVSADNPCEPTAMIGEENVVVDVEVVFPVRYDMIAAVVPAALVPTPASSSTPVVFGAKSAPSPSRPGCSFIRVSSCPLVSAAAWKRGTYPKETVLFSPISARERLVKADVNPRLSNNVKPIIVVISFDNSGTQKVLATRSGTSPGRGQKLQSRLIASSDCPKFFLGTMLRLGHDKIPGRP